QTCALPISPSRPTRPCLPHPGAGVDCLRRRDERLASPALAQYDGLMPAHHDRAWTSEAVRRIEADFNRSADTHLIRIELPRFPGITLYLKDESSHPTGSLKHRLARSLFLYALCNDWIGPKTTMVEASSAST